jgi:dynein heavy chain
VLFLKTEPEKLSLASLKTNVLQNDLSGMPLEHLEKVISEVYLPLLSNPANQEGWGEVASKEILDKLHGFLASVSITVGSTKGKTCLPLPPDVAGGSGGDTKERIHLLEGAVITWTKQIKNVLKLEPDGLLKQGLHPTPDMEIEFWKSKAANLNAVFDQLQSSRIRRVLQFLEAAKSTYCLPFARLCKEVFAARLEANDNVKYLRTLESWFSRLNSADEFTSLVELFKPIMHILLLIWKNSKYYNTPARLVVLMREICNALITQAFGYLSGKQLFQLIEEEEAAEGVNKLKTILRVCGAFKATYFDYRDTANAECPSNQWRIQNNALFMRLDAFLERVHDILDLTQTIMQFSRLSRIDIGGTKGKTLTNSVQQIHADFEATVSGFKTVQYDIMDVSKKEFDDDFYEFRCAIKNLERRLASVLTQGFDDCATIYGRFKLLDSFDELLERPIIADELERKQIALVQAYGADLKRVQELFLTEREAPPISWNLPPIAGALTWCRGLKERISDPMSKLKQLNRSIMNREEAKEVAKVYAAIVASLEDYEHQKIEEWGSDVERSSQAKLKLPLLSYQRDAAHLLTVNFDPALVKLLREVKYFLLLGLEVPSSALEIFQKAETFRRQTGNLDLIVNMYNRMVSEMLPVEAPLMKTHMTKIEATLQSGLKDINWKSTAIESFIADSQVRVWSARCRDRCAVVCGCCRRWSAPLHVPVLVLVPVVALVYRTFSLRPHPPPASLRAVLRQGRARRAVPSQGQPARDPGHSRQVVVGAAAAAQAQARDAVRVQCSAEAADRDAVPGDQGRRPHHRQEAAGVARGHEGGQGAPELARVRGLYQQHRHHGPVAPRHQVAAVPVRAA